VYSSYFYVILRLGYMNYTLEHVKYKLIVTWPTTVSKSLPSTLNSSCWTEFKFVWVFSVLQQELARIITK